MLERFASPAHRLQKLLGQAHTAIPDTLRACAGRRVLPCRAAAPGAQAHVGFQGLTDPVEGFSS